MNLAYLCHRIPYPPDKGDKIRSYHQVEWLARRHRLHLFTLIDDPADAAHVAPLREMVSSLHVERVSPRVQRLRSLAAIPAGKSLSEAYFHRARLRSRLRELARSDAESNEPLDLVFAFSSAMAPYADVVDAPLAVDFVDVDSAKWEAYAQAARGPLRWLFRREARCVRALEKAVSERADLTVLCTPREVDDLRAFASPREVVAIGNGTDTEYFSPDGGPDWDDPRVVFTGAMDYRANVDAVVWYAEQVHGRVRAGRPAVRLDIVGSNPAPAVRKLAGPGVRVTGRVPDVRPHVRRAAVAVAPLRVARGVQNKVLEALACGTPVVATTAALGGVPDPRGVLVADDPEAFAAAVGRVLDDRALRDRLGAEGRRYVEERFRWGRSMGELERRLLAVASRPRAARSEVPYGSGA